jgi:hypothetical protein
VPIDTHRVAPLCSRSQDVHDVRGRIRRRTCGAPPAQSGRAGSPVQGEPEHPAPRRLRKRRAGMRVTPISRPSPVHRLGEAIGELALMGTTLPVAGARGQASARRRH